MRTYDRRRFRRWLQDRDRRAQKVCTALYCPISTYLRLDRYEDSEEDFSANDEAAKLDAPFAAAVDKASGPNKDWNRLSARDCLMILDALEANESRMQPPPPRPLFG